MVKVASARAGRKCLIPSAPNVGSLENPSEQWRTRTGRQHQESGASLWCARCCLARPRVVPSLAGDSHGCSIDCTQRGHQLPRIVRTTEGASAVRSASDLIRGRHSGLPPSRSAHGGCCPAISCAGFGLLLGQLVGVFVFVTADPKQLLEAMANRSRAVTFGDAAPKTVDEFVATPRAARVWYDSVMETADNRSPIYGFPNNAAHINSEAGTTLSSPGRKNTSDWERASHVARTMVWGLSYVYVVVDLRRLQGVTRGQLADYVAMVGLAQINPGAQLGDAPTILKLFDGAPQAALPGMTAWDQAFLRSLYTVDQKVMVQQGEIGLNMVREIVH